MDNFDELNELVISSSGRKRKIKAETVSRSLAKAVRYDGEGKAQCIVCNQIHTVYDHNNNVFVRLLHCHLRKLQRLNECFLNSNI